MKIRLTFYLSGRLTITHDTPEFASVDEAEKTMQRLMREPNSSLTLHGNDGTKRVISGNHVVTVSVEPIVEG